MNDDLLNSRQDICCPLKKCLVLCQLVLLDFVKTYFYLLALIEVMGIDWVTRSWSILSKSGLDNYVVKRSKRPLLEEFS